MTAPGTAPAPASSSAAAASPLALALRLLRPFWRLVLLSTLMGTLGGIATALLLAVINRALRGEGDMVSFAWAFGGLCLAALLGQGAAGLGSAIVGQKVVVAVRRELVAHILTAPIARLERLRVHRLMATLGGDVDALSGFSLVLSGLGVAVAITCGCLGYLVLLSPPLFLVTLLVLGLGVGGHARMRRLGQARFAAARAAEDDLQRHYRAITEGAKELRLNRPRRIRLFHADLEATITRIAKLRLRGLGVFLGANLFGSLALFAVIGGILLMTRAAPEAIGVEDVSGFVLVLLFMKGPMQQILGALPSLGRAQIALRRIAELGAAGQEGGDLPGLAPGMGEGAVPMPAEITLEAVSYRFPESAAGPGFTLGPLTLTLRRGESVVITGENGCGKTTLIKLILGLYQPTAGRVLLDGRPVRAGEWDEYRQLFSAVFADYHLFDDGMAEGRQAAEAARLLDAFDLATKTALKDGRFTTTDLSAGERKRLALILLALEGRPIVVFDEWAAEQDPGFRHRFYHTVLPDLKRQGRTVIVVSHDEGYFDCADHRIVLKNGKLAG